MKNNNRIRSLVVSVALLSCAVSAWPQTPEQLRQLQNLTAAERAALLEALGQAPIQSDVPLSEPQVVVPRPPLEAPDDDTDTASGDTRPALRPFGYDLFAGEPSTFAPATDIPVPVDYVIGPGDTIDVQLFGNENAQYNLVVTRDGVLNFPGIGPISVAGLEFGDLQKSLQQRISEQMIGVNSSISMGPLRSIRVFVLGDAYRPGSYTVSSLSTMTNTLLVSGGINTIGSLRNVQLKRGGKLVTSLDLYDLLLRGDTSDDSRLQPGDVIFVPPSGPTVGVDGAVRRPAIYEIRGEKTVGEVVALAGGMLPSAYPQASRVERINPRRERTVIDVDLSTTAGLAVAVAGDDTIRIFSVLERKEDIVQLSGHVNRDGVYQWQPGMRISDLLPSIRDLRPRADLNYVLVRRELPGSVKIRALSANLESALANRGGEPDLELQPRDQVTVFELGVDRTDAVQPLLVELRLQSGNGEATREVGINGRVRSPGRYPLELGMRVSDLIRAGGYLDEAAYGLEAELTRYAVVAGESRETSLQSIDLTRVLAGDEAADLILEPYDLLSIREIPNWRELEQAQVIGEVRFPGTYPIRRGETLSSLIQRAGGLTEVAFPDGAVFLREELRFREQLQLDELATRLQGEINSNAAAESESSEIAAARLALLEQVRETKATGRLVISLREIMSGANGPGGDVILQDGDRLLIPQASQTVTVIGEVQFPTSHVFEQNLGRNEYIDRSGGMTADADERRVYVVHADGAVEPGRRSLFFRGRSGGDIRPGDTIVVPLDADRMSQLSMWTNVTTIIYNIGVAAAAVASF